MSAPNLSDVTLALVDANVLACWESKVKLGLECSLWPFLLLGYKWDWMGLLGLG